MKLLGSDEVGVVHWSSSQWRFLDELSVKILAREDNAFVARTCGGVGGAGVGGHGHGDDDGDNEIDFLVYNNTGYGMWQAMHPKPVSAIVDEFGRLNVKVICLILFTRCLCNKECLFFF